MRGRVGGRPHAERTPPTLHRNHYERASKHPRRPLSAPAPFARHFDVLLRLTPRFPGKPKDAERIQRDSVSGCRAALGDSHPETLVSLTHLVGLYRAQNKLSEAEPLAREALAGWRALEANEPVPRHTMTAINILAELL
eukprot:3490754-Pleurochrysis_carterae.AAC.1